MLLWSSQHNHHCCISKNVYLFVVFFALLSCKSDCRESKIECSVFFWWSLLWLIITDCVCLCFFFDALNCLILRPFFFFWNDYCTNSSVNQCLESFWSVLWMYWFLSLIWGSFFKGSLKFVKTVLQRDQIKQVLPNSGWTQRDYARRYNPLVSTTSILCTLKHTMQRKATSLYSNISIIRA